MRRTGEELGGYVLVRRIGSGGMGTVYEAIDADDRHVALKLLHPQVGADPEARDRLRREVATLHRVRHTGVARVLDAEADSDEAFVVTELVDGQTLEESVREHGPFEPDELASLAHGLHDALAAIHAAGVVHRDVKPSNVMLTDDGPVLIDFGISQILDDVRYTQTGLVTGTPGYIDPQMVAGAPPGEAGDWWGWAAVLVFAGTGRAPFGRGPMEVVLGRVARGDVDVAGLPPAIAAAFRASLAPAPEARQAPLALLAVLDAGAQGTLDPAPPPEPGTVALPVQAGAVALSTTGRDADPTALIAGSPTLVVAVAAPPRPPTIAPVIAPATAPPAAPPGAGSAAGSAPSPAAAPTGSPAGLPSGPPPPPSADLGTMVATVDAGRAALTRPPGPPAPSVTAPVTAAPTAAPAGGQPVGPGGPANPYAVRPTAPAPVPVPWTPAARAWAPGPQAGPPGAVPAPPPDVPVEPPAWARPAPPRTALVAWFGVVAAASATMWPGWALLGTAAAMVVSAATGSGARAIRERRLRSGPRRSDLLVASLSSPLHLLRGALHVLVSLAVGLLAGIGVWWFAGLVAGGGIDALGGPGGLGEVPQSLIMGLSAGATVLLAWLAPTSRIAREGARSVLAVVAPGPTATVLLVLAGLVVALVALGLALAGMGPPDWAPVTGPPA